MYPLSYSYQLDTDQTNIGDYSPLSWLVRRDQPEVSEKNDQGVSMNPDCSAGDLDAPVTPPVTSDDEAAAMLQHIESVLGMPIAFVD